MLSDNSLALSPTLQARLCRIADRFPVMIIDGVFADPHGLRNEALSLPFSLSRHGYPGRHSKLDPTAPQVHRLAAQFLDVVNLHYIPKLGLRNESGSVERLENVELDFSVVDMPPDRLRPAQTVPHIDPVPVFGLVYLNEEDRGGTLFFDRTAEVAPASVSMEPTGYIVDSRDEWVKIGAIEGRFNRLAIYPGFVPHSGEIRGDWITKEMIGSNVRLTMRVMFFE